MNADTQVVSLWDATAPALEPLPPLGTDIECEVAIVGGGFTGLSTALHLGELGVKSVVLEAEKIGYGGSGRNAGMVNPGVWLPPDDVAKYLGAEAGERLNRGFRDGPSLVFDLIRRHGIDCEATQNGSMHLASSQKMLKKILARGEQLAARGSEVEVLDQQTVEKKFGAPGFVGGILDPKAGTINPMGYVRGLAQAAMKVGAKIFCESPATALEREGDMWRVRTATGSLKARRVLLATNGYTDDLWPGLKQEVFPFYFCFFATKPLSENLRGSILPNREAAWDSEEPTIGIRFDANGRLILGTIGSIPEQGSNFRHRWAENRIRKYFPHLGETEWDTSWMGRIAFTTDHLPHLHELAPGLLTVIGYNGRGIAPGTIMGRAMAHHLAGSDEVEMPLPFTAHSRASFGPVRSMIYNVGAGVLQRMQMMRSP